MTVFSNLINRHVLRHMSKVEKYCQPIKNHFGVIHFWYHVVTHEGYFSLIGTHPSWMESYFGSEDLFSNNAFFKSPKITKTGVSFIDKISPHYEACFNSRSGRLSANLNASPRLVFLEKTDQGIEGFGFTSSFPAKAFNLMCLNEMPILKNFAANFKREFGPTLRQMEEDSVDVATLSGPSFYAKDPIFQEVPTFDKQSFLSDFGFSNLLKLSKREKDVLFFLAKGIFAFQIAENLDLSTRTVEHYIENIKYKLHCESKADLIQKANHYLSLGLV